MLQITNYGSVTDLRFKTKELLKKAQEDPVLILSQNTPQAVLLSYSSYQDVVDMLDDYYLSIKAQEYEKEDDSKIKYVSSSDVKKMFGIK